MLISGNSICLPLLVVTVLPHSVIVKVKTGAQTDASTVGFPQRMVLLKSRLVLPVTKRAQCKMNILENKNAVKIYSFLPALPTPLSLSFQICHGVCLYTIVH